MIFGELSGELSGELFGESPGAGVGEDQFALPRWINTARMMITPLTNPCQ